MVSEGAKLLQHFLVPKHEVLGEKEAAEVLASYRVTKETLPKISASDPAIKQMKVEEGDIVKIMRKGDVNPNMENVYYRVVK